MTVVMEEGVVLRRGSLVPAPSEEKSAVVLVPPPLRYQFYTNSLAPTSWKDSQLQGTFGHEGVKSCSNGGSRWQGKGLQDPSEWSKFKPVFPSVCVCSFQEEAKCPYFTYLFCKILLRSKLEDEIFILNPSSTKTTTYFFAITTCWTILLCISILFPG
jgi:hypothetical protein